MSDDDLDPAVLARLAAIAAAGTADRVLRAASDRGDALRGLTDRVPEGVRERFAEGINQLRSGLTSSLAEMLNELPEHVVQQLASSGDVPGEARRIVEDALPGLRDDVARSIKEMLSRRDPPDMP